MTMIVEAIYENGVLKPLRKINLREGERVIIRIERDTLAIAREIRAKIRDRLHGKDLLRILSSERDRFG